jgi:hypothetical protein
MKPSSTYSGVALLPKGVGTLSAPKEQKIAISPYMRQ